jgi:hypothetical protein
MRTGLFCSTPIIMKDFLQAVKSHMLEDPGDEEKRRAEICAGCEFKEKKIYAQIFKAEMKEINGYVCTKCICPLATKIFAKEPENICQKWK